MSAGAPARQEGISVLYLVPVGAFSGASRSLLELLHGLPAGAVRPRLLVARGNTAEVLQREGHPVLTARGFAQFDTTRFGHYRGLRWLILLRELVLLPFTVAGIVRARLAWPDIDVIHVNEITALAAALLAKALYRKPLVVHVRSVQQTEGAALRTKLLACLLRRHADAVVAIDATVRASLPAGVEAAIVHNGFTPVTGAGARSAGADLAGRLHPGSLRVGMIGSLLALKGVYDLLEAASICAARGANVDFVVVGSNTRRLSGLRGTLLRWSGFAHDVEGDVRRFVAAHGIHDRVHGIAFTTDISAIYENLDVILFPSHLGAIGRPVLEAACFGVPCIAAVDAPSPDTFVPGETGVQVPARDPQALAEAIIGLCANRDEVRRMGDAARALAQRNFDSSRNAQRMYEIYQRLREPAKN